MAQEESGGAFALRVAALLKRVEFRRADTSAEKETIFRMRYEAYARGGYIERISSGLFTDEGDETENVWLIGVFIDGELASSIRLHVASRRRHWLPDKASFGDLISPRLEDGDVLIDATRQTSRIEFTRAYPFLPLVTMRCGFLAMQHFDADYMLGTCREEYRMAFRRLFGSATWSEARPYPPLTRPHVLMAYDCQAQWLASEARYPFLQSTPAEQRALFGRSSNTGADLYDDLTAGHRERPLGLKHKSTTCPA